MTRPSKGTAVVALVVVALSIGAIGAGATTVTCLDRNATIVGTASGEKLEGTSGPDVIAGRGGADEIEGKGGADVICGGDGADTIEGDGGNDTLFGGAGNDKLEGKTGDDRFAAARERTPSRVASATTPASEEKWFRVAERSPERDRDRQLLGPANDRQLDRPGRRREDLVEVVRAGDGLPRRARDQVPLAHAGARGRTVVLDAPDQHAVGRLEADRRAHPARHVLRDDRDPEARAGRLLAAAERVDARAQRLVRGDREVEPLPQPVRVEAEEPAPRIDDGAA